MEIAVFWKRLRDLKVQYTEDIDMPENKEVSKVIPGKIKSSNIKPQIN
jgi:hypothetical protein